MGQDSELMTLLPRHPMNAPKTPPPKETLALAGVKRMDDAGLFPKALFKKVKPGQLLPNTSSSGPVTPADPTKNGPARLKWKRPLFQISGGSSSQKNNLDSARESEARHVHSK